MKKIIHTLGLTIIFIGVLSINSFATTIIPFANLGEMAKASDAVVLAKVLDNYEFQDGEIKRYHTSFQIVQRIKGDVTNEFIIQNLKLSIGDHHKAVFGEAEFEKGNTYLIFLYKAGPDYWYPWMMAHGVFKEWEYQGEKLLVPVENAMNFSFNNRKINYDFEPFYVYDRDKLAHMLATIVQKMGTWDSHYAKTSYSLNQFKSVENRDHPPHCTYIANTDGQHGRFDGFPVIPVPIYHHEDGDNSTCSTTSITKTQNAITHLNNNYPGINLMDSGTHNYVPPVGCSDATDTNFTGWVSSNLGGARNIVIQYDDPCSEIAPLGGSSGCNGTLAFGGHWWSTTDTSWHDGFPWFNVRFGNVVVNEDVGDCYCSSPFNYELMMTHEITHAMGFSHISTGVGTANMNPSCCNNISTWDFDCVNYTYPDATVPADLIHFSGSANQIAIRLEWETEIEINSDVYIIEKQNRWGKFEEVARVKAAGNSIKRTKYQSIDPSPIIGANVYRLILQDQNGELQIFETTSVDYYKGMSFNIYPNPVYQENVVVDIGSESATVLSIQINDLNGKKVIHQTTFVDRGLNQLSLDISSMLPGIYLVQFSTEKTREIQRFTVAN